jgi:hypothetical protein
VGDRDGQTAGAADLRSAALVGQRAHDDHEPAATEGPAAPYEATLLLDDELRRRGVRSRTELER